MLQQKHRHQVALAGQVIDSVTGDAITGARIKIVQAPEKFIDVVIFKTKLFGLPKSLSTNRSYSKISSQTPNLRSPKIQEFQEQLTKLQINSQESLESFKILINDSYLDNIQKFQLLQGFLDSLESGKRINTEYLERTYAKSDGWFYFTDLPVGSYQLEASFPIAGMRYANTLIDVQIADIKSNIELDQNDSFSDRLKLILRLNPTTVFGKVIDSKTNECIDMAKVKVSENEDYAISSKTVNQNGSGKWNYRLVALEPNQPCTTLIVSARGYITQQHQVYLQTGDIKQLDFQLVSQ